MRRSYVWPCALAPRCPARPSQCTWLGARLGLGFVPPPPFGPDAALLCRSGGVLRGCASARGSSVRVAHPDVRVARPRPSVAPPGLAPRGQVVPGLVRSPGGVKLLAMSEDPAHRGPGALGRQNQPRRAALRGVAQTACFTRGDQLLGPQACLPESGRLRPKSPQFGACAVLDAEHPLTQT